MKIKIEDLSHDGRGIGRIEGKAVFVEGAYPGETIEIEIIKEKKRYLKGRVKQIIKAGSDRIEDLCPDFYRCGGCQFCDFKYSAQLEFKKNRVLNDFKKFANIDLENIGIHGMDDFYHYRNHVQLRVKNREIGYITKDYKKIFTPQNCIIAPESTDKIIKIIKGYRYLDKIILLGIRENYLGKKMLILVTEEERKSKKILDIADILEDLKEVGVSHIYENKNSNPKYHYGHKSIKLYGEGDFIEEILGTKFILSPTSFFQVNRSQAEFLYRKGIANLDLNPSDKVLELYSGIGTITMEIAKKAKAVTAIEYAKSSVEDAKKNAELNGIDNIEFISGKVEEKLEAFDKSYRKLLLDPPRAGANRKVIDEIISLQPEIISYISCDPATLARDVGILVEKGSYKVEKVELVDLFPLTSHVELVALMSRVEK